MEMPLWKVPIRDHAIDFSQQDRLRGETRSEWPTCSIQ